MICVMSLSDLHNSGVNAIDNKDSDANEDDINNEEFDNEIVAENIASVKDENENEEMCKPSLTEMKMQKLFYRGLSLLYY